MTRCSLLCLVCSLLCLGIPGPPSPTEAAAPGSGTEPVVAQHLGAQTLAVLAGAVRVETFRIGVTPAHGQPAPTTRIDDRPLFATGPAQDKAFAATLSVILRDPRLYDARRDRCLFHPGVVLRVWDGGRASVDCLLCFHCDDILILTRDATGRVVHTEFANFAPLRPTLLLLVKQTFPADQEIQGLSAK